MATETNPESPVYGQYSCPRDTCFEGPGLSYLNVKYDFGPDDIGPPLQNRWL